MRIKIWDVNYSFCCRTWPLWRECRCNTGKMGYDVMAMDIAEDVVQDLSDTLGYVVCADCSDEKNLTAIGAGNADVAVVAVGELSASLMTTLLLKDMGVKKIVVKALDPLHGKMLQKIGADKVIYSEKKWASG